MQHRPAGRGPDGHTQEAQAELIRRLLVTSLQDEVIRGEEESGVPNQPSYALFRYARNQSWTLVRGTVKGIQSYIKRARWSGNATRLLEIPVEGCAFLSYAENEKPFIVVEHGASFAFVLD